MENRIMYRFLFKKDGILREDIFEVAEANDELAIATFENRNPNENWREFYRLGNHINATKNQQR